MNADTGNILASILTTHRASDAAQVSVLRAQLDDPVNEEYQQLLQQFHLSTYQQHSLRRLLQRYRALYPDTSVVQSIPSTTNSGKNVLQWLTKQLDNAPIHY